MSQRTTTHGAATLATGILTSRILGFARDMLSATDALSRALMVLPAEAREHGDATTKSLIEGI